MINLHYGCGVEVAPGWWNCDASPTLYLQRLPVVGPLFTLMLSPRFPSIIRFGDIVRGLPLAESSCELAYCSHMLEHLALEDCRAALRNTFRYLRQGGVFRLVVPDLEQHILSYTESTDAAAALRFMQWTNLGRTTRPRGMLRSIKHSFGNQAHLWMWDYKSLRAELEAAGFRDIRRCQLGDAKQDAFREVENAARFEHALAIECSKPLSMISEPDEPFPSDT